MAKKLIAFDDQQILKIEQIVMDQDEPGALKYLEDLRTMIKRDQICCNPMEFKTREEVEQVIDKLKGRS